MSIIYLSGSTYGPIFESPRPDLGVMMHPRIGNKDPLERVPWGADNGCFSQGDAFDEDAWFRWLDSKEGAWSQLLFATAPDVIFDPVGTLERSLSVLPRIRERGIPAAFVLQDGVRPDQVPWDAVDVVFVGGSTEFKLSEKAYWIVGLARSLGKKAHLGRVNSFRRLKAANVSAFDSADGTYLKFGPDKNFPKLISWLDWNNCQAPLGLFE
jgi:hypothetical protein